MIVLDYVIANEDRHFNNFGVLRNAETLEWLGFAPIYDSGSSLGYDKMPAQMRSEKEVGLQALQKPSCGADKAGLRLQLDRFR